MADSATLSPTKPAASKPARGLGKGISALLGDDDDAPAIAAATPGTSTPSNPAPTAAPAGGGMQEMPVTQLSSGRYQPRVTFAQDALQELSDSIKHNGVMQPLLVRKVSDGKTPYEIIAGERRWRAAQMAGLTTVPVIIKELDDSTALECAIIENVQRKDLSPLEEAEGYQRLIREFSYSQEDLSKAVGKSRSHISNLIRLLALPDEVKKMMDDGFLTLGHARALLTLPGDITEHAKEVVRRNLNVRQTEQLARDVQNPRPVSHSATRVPGEAKDADITALEEALSQNIGLKVRIKDRGDRGEIIISYNTLENLDDILRKLGGVV